MTAKARILKNRSNQACTKHDWQEPWPIAALRQCTQYGAWIVPLWSGTRVKSHDNHRIRTPRPCHLSRAGLNHDRRPCRNRPSRVRLDTPSPALRQ
jgi:hypothetical protein